MRRRNRGARRGSGRRGRTPWSARDAPVPAFVRRFKCLQLARSRPGAGCGPGGPPYGTSITGACQNAALLAAGSSTVTWQLYLPGDNLPSARLNFRGTALDFGSSPSVTAAAPFRTPCLAAVEAHERHQRLHGGGAALVGLQVDIHVAALAEDARHAGITCIPSWISGFTDGPPLSLMLNNASARAMRWPVRTTELMGIRLVSLLRLESRDLVK